MSMITACHAREPGLNAPLTHIPVRHTDRKVEVAARMVVRPGYEKGRAACVVWRPEADGRGLGSPLPNGCQPRSYEKRLTKKILHYVQNDSLMSF